MGSELSSALAGCVRVFHFVVSSELNATQSNGGEAASDFQNKEHSMSSWGILSIALSFMRTGALND